MTVNPAYINEKGEAVASTDLTSQIFKVIDKELAGAYYYDGEYADKTTIVYSINESEEDLEALTEEGKTIPAIANNKLTWNDWNKRTLKVKAELKINNDRVLDTEEFVVTIADPVAEAITVNSEVDATIYAGETDRSFTVASMLQLAAQQGSAINASTNVFAAGSEMGLNADLAKALQGSATYTLAEGTNPIVSLDEEGMGVLTLDESALEITEFSVNVKVVYTYQFGTREFDATIKVKPGTKPAE